MADPEPVKAGSKYIYGKGFATCPTLANSRLIHMRTNLF